MTTNTIPDHAQDGFNPNDITRRLRELGSFCNGITPNTLPLEPNTDDVEAFQQDLLLFAEKFDAVFRACGEHLKAHFPDTDLECFDRPVFGAIDGNATHECDKAIEELQEAAWEAA